MSRHTARHDQLESQLVAGILRLVLFAIAGVAGWMLGGLVGGFVGAGLDIVFTGERIPEFGAAVAPFYWTTGILGAVAGAIGSIAWLAIRMQRSAEAGEDRGEPRRTTRGASGRTIIAVGVVVVAAGALAVIGLQFVGIVIGAVFAVIGMMVVLLGYGRIVGERGDRVEL
jgi:MFS family permease